MEEQEQLQRENEELLATMVAAEAAPEPGTLHPRDVLHRGDEDLPVPMVAKTLTSAGWRYIYDTRTGDRSLTNVNMLPAQLRKKREDGSLIFTTHKPSVAPPQGTMKCLLHPVSPNRREYDELGFPTCPKSNLSSKFQVERHMANRHKVEWATIQRERQAARDAERWELEKVVLEKAAQGQAPAVRAKPVPRNEGKGD